MKNKIKEILKLLFLLLAFFNLSSLISMGLNLLNIDTKLFGYAEVSYLSCLVDAILVIIIVIVYEKSLSKDWYLFKSKFDFKELLIYLALFFGVKVLSAIVTVIISLIIGSDILTSENQSIIETLTNSSPIIMMISSVIFAPLLEEVIFRLGFRKVFRNDYLFILISGFVFGLMHIFPTDIALSVALTQGITYVAIGSFLSWTYVKKGNIWFVILLHAANNLISMLALI